MKRTDSKLIQRHIPCPKCPSSDAYCVYDDGHGHCFSCGYHFFNDNKDFNLNDAANFTYEFIGCRGITADTMRYYGVRTKVSAEGEPLELGFDYRSAIKCRSLIRKDFRWVGESKPGLFGIDKFAAGANKAIVLTEGELDALSLWQVLKIPCVSVRSAGSAVGDVSALRSELNAYERIYLAFDADPAGEAATAGVARLFDYNKLYHIRFSNRKDANEYLQHNETVELLNLFHNARRYLPSSIISSFEDFEKILSKPIAEGIPYPFPSLTRMTYGIRTGEVVLLKAPEKVGKTALMKAIEFNILKETDANVGAIFIEEPREHHLRTLAGLQLRKPVHLPDSSSSSDEVFTALRQAVREDNRLFIYNHFGTSDPDIILDTIRFLVTCCGVRYVLFDHISMAVTGQAGESDERRALEYLATRLEMMVKELNFALIMVSHVNDNGQTRGSHYLTKLADIVISAQRDTMSPDEVERSTIHLSVPFNRFCASSGYCCGVVFDHDTYTLAERETANDNQSSSGRADTLWQAVSHGIAA